MVALGSSAVLWWGLLACLPAASPFALGLGGGGGGLRSRGVAGLRMIAGSGVTVVGVSGGAAESIVYKLSEGGGGGSVTAVMDKAPVSPLLQAAVAASRVKLVLTEKIETPEQLSDLLSSKTVVVVGDEGDAELRGNLQKDSMKVLGGGETYWDTLKAKETAAAVKMFDKTLAALPKTVKELICAVSIDSTSDKRSAQEVPNPLSGLLKAAGVSQDAFSRYAKFCSDNAIPFSSFRYGQLTGGVVGAEPLPFMGLPAIEPELHPSYVHGGVVLTSAQNNQYASTELCTRAALSEAIVRKITTQKSGSTLDALVVSIVGTSPSDRDWASLFQRMQAGGNVELLRIDLAEVKKPAALANWLVDSWFPQALIDADAATILSGARPVRARKISDALVRIAWEELRADLSVRAAGGLEIIIETGAGAGAGTGAALRVVRSGAEVGGGGNQLPGEMQLVDKLLEGINKVAFKKGLASPLV